MKELGRELLILGIVYGMGIALAAVTPIPSSLASMAVLFMALQFGLVKEQFLSKVTPLILAHIALFFIAPAIKIINSMDALKGAGVKIVVILVLSNMIVMGVTGFVVQQLLKRRNHGTH